ncbi:2-dehydro-3-deoxyphosphogluconate aldolase/(4S)-4-hydroxy-2-oxoglutarate aldolase [Thermocatellispora tengchongensis]|uniref:2-dehydro-3-deoxyphosphogluconate aldolase/(4S)-4-hydroxy-2-oxoglutarate aldolase n=1 Tax=Thermocatellispora tengchongensis TaxID=1073253 RepID=A0A840P9A4_9ACTN|nr:bifunctional 4-hydroxy-2-oxoglutarate aldolase/2-dehydro-3-deoxy-phosphogluconate aldolase [Thermocatellispora tengchongensis]MBB5134020.1 2-dehydro-3-deoxyphosphogluconate aldolase/(4S)-4-hydroxy-2-oxoglutarate aldolase [Thermocatellispora tengchongensis]
MDLLDILRDRRLVAIIRGRDPEASYATACALVEEGVDVLEVSLTGADALHVIGRIAKALGGDVVLGAGTVMTEADAEAVAEAGATFTVTPALGPGALRSIELGLPSLIGALTPTEVWNAHTAGAAAVKIFPASLGGPGHLAALRDPFPRIPLVPVGGVRTDQVAAYLDAGAAAVGVGSPLVGDAPHGGDLDALRERARSFRQVVAR